MLAGIEPVRGAAHDVICLIGASGSGKSTLLRCPICSSRSTSGGSACSGEPDHRGGRRRQPGHRHIGIVFQSFNLFAAHDRAAERDAGPDQGAEMRPCRPPDEARALLGQVRPGSDKAADYPDRLSGGQQQRVAIVRALAVQPQIMLLGRGDQRARSRTGRRGARRDHASWRPAGMTMLVATHEMGFARDIASRVCFLEEGRIIEEAPPAELFTNPKDERTRRFLRRIVEAKRL